MDHTFSSPRQATTAILVVLAIISQAWYAVFLFTPGNIGTPWVYALLVVADVIGMFQLLGAWLTILFAHPPATVETNRLRQAILKHGVKNVPHSVVSVFLPVAGEPLDLVRQTAICARDMRIAHRTIILDDGGSDAMRDLARQLGIEYLRRPKPDGRKAGNLNYGLDHVKTDYVVIFDADHQASPDFLLVTLPYLLADPKLAFVQTPQYYGNREGFISGGDAETQDVFYRHIQYGKNAFNAAFFVGTNAVFRRAALDDIDGFNIVSQSEDIWTALSIHERGWKSLFLPQVLAVGLAPNTVERLFRQQFRWSRGSFEMFFNCNPLLNRSLTLDQKLQYLHSTMFYFTGFSVALFFIMPLLFVYFDLQPLHVSNAGVWLLHFLPYYVMMFVTIVHLLGTMPKWRTFVLALASFPSHITACFSALIGRNLQWSVTGVIRKASDHVTAVTPHLLILLFSAGGIPILLFMHPLNGLTLSMCGWLTFNSLILFSICKRALPQFANAEVKAPSVAKLSAAAFPKAV